MTAGACGPQGCGDCTLACAGATPGASPGGEDDLTVTAAGGIVIAVLAGMVAVRAVAWVATLAGVTAGAGVALAGAALVARTSRRSGLGDAFADLPVRLLPYVTAAFVATVLARAGTALLA